ncbi:unnamed protein product [Eruca vesicaria subsp. sativa]|uniref:Uncharacterized protein n=1 Tax=Eruca vesicaria subsp. sativa TaxID=29727 RepID=A0ABC8K3S7_ERUVS|nr:unnamed protein product [Eruca vesicaria subsp. sativa]
MGTFYCMIILSNLQDITEENKSYGHTGEKSIVFKPIYFLSGSSGDSFKKKKDRVLLVRWKISSKVQREGVKGFNETITQ